MNEIIKPITDQNTLNDFYNKCKIEKVLAVDTEFIRDSTYYPSLCLIQIAGINFAAAIDPLAKLDMSPIWELLLNKNILKVFHACRQDIEIFFGLMGEIPTPIYDTQIAAMFCGLGDQVGYESLVNNFLGLSINKEHQFTNWLQRPLSQNQINYAISDVTHLINIFPLIRQAIKDNNREEWVTKELEHLSKKELYQVKADEVWKKIKLKNSNPQMLNLLKYLASWRENECKKRNIPRNRLIRDDVLINISFSKPKTISELKKIRAIPKNLSNDDFFQILEVVDKAQKVKRDEWPLISTSTSPQISKSSLELLKILLKYCSEENGLAEKVIANTDDLKSILEGQKKNMKVFTGWRNKIFGEIALSLLNGKLAFKMEKGKIKKIDI
ncbi:ribonuclease D [Alphaproteobacteria bacterium]|jgi:ribonuclease D|nr:ribonuclease D [Alphaproteobacteria bacterium]